MGWKTMGSICDTGASQDECCCGNYCALASGQSAGGTGVCQRDDGMVTGGRYTRTPKEWLRSPIWDRPDQWYDNVARGGGGYRNMAGQYQEHRGYMNASGKMGMGTSVGVIGVVMIFGMLYLLNRYVEAQPTKA